MAGIFMGAAGAPTITPITVSSNWGTTGPGASPQTSPTRTLTVPAGNSGGVVYTVVTNGTTLKSKNGGTFNSFVNGDGETLANNDTMAFRLTGTTKTATITMTDYDTGVTIGTSSISTT